MIEYPAQSVEVSVSVLRPEDCLAGGGEMGALMRSMDWSQTDFGPVPTWPQSLRTAVSMMLASRFAMVVAWGPDFRFFYNDRYRPILGTTKHPDALGSPGRVIFPEVWSVVGPEFEKVRNGETFAIDDWLLPLDRNGYLEDCWFTLSYSPIRDETGGVGGLLAVVAETTGRVLSERRLTTLRNLARRAADAKTEDEACLNAASVFEQDPLDIPFAVFYLLESEGKRFRRVCAVGLEPTHPANPHIVDLDFPEDQQAWPLERVARTAQGEVLHELTERFGTLPGGAYEEDSHTAVLLPLTRPGLEHPYGILVIGVSPRRALDDRYREFFDLAADHIATAISNARALQEERRRAEALAQIDQAKTAFFSNVSHEFRTPLTLLLGPTEDALATSEQTLRGENLRTVHRNGLRLLKLVNALLDFSRIEAGRVQAVYEPVNLAKLTEQLASGFRSAIERAGLTLQFIAEPLTETAFVDVEMWEQIVLNLLSNALKCTFEGGITVTLREENKRFRLAVTDTGIGIPEYELPRIFERFHRVEGAKSRTHEGTGIGLSLVQELVRLHGGDIRVDSIVGRGTAFTVSIPRGSSHLPADRISTARTAPSTPTGIAPFMEEAIRWIGNGVDGPPNASKPSAGPISPVVAEPSHERILIVDDNADMRAYLVQILRAHSNVETAADGLAALEIIQARRPDLVLTDVMMPCLDGFGLLEAIRRNEATRDIRVVMLSARAGEESRVQGLAAGADDYLTKPFSARELTARVNSQLAIARTHRHVEQRRSELYSLFMQAPAPICVIRGMELKFEMANRLYLKIVGGREIVGKRFLEGLPELRGQGLDDLLLNVMRTGEPFAGNEVPIRLARGGTGVVEETHFTFVLSPLANPDGTIERVMVFANDVTDQVTARRTAEAASRSKDEFLAVLSHELRNPLAPIMTALHLIRLRTDQVLAREWSIIERQVQHMARLVDDLLDVSRITQGKIQLRKKRLELAPVVQKALEIASPLIEEKGQHLSVELPDTGLPVFVDEVRMAQVFANLLTNASRYTEVGGRITVHAASEAGRVILKVRDTGIGISAEQLPRVFDMFVQGSRSSAQGGLGLGLTIVKNLAELHGAHVAARSEGLGKGSEFTISLRMAEPSHDAAEAPRAAAPVPAQHQRVLVVDDNQDGAEALAMTLILVGHEVRMAFDGPSALSIAETFKPTVVLLDIGLPVMSGYEVARALRTMPFGNKVRIIAVSGYAQESDRARSKEAGFNLHLVKPLDFASVESIIGNPAA